MEKNKTETAKKRLAVCLLLAMEQHLKIDNNETKINAALVALVVNKLMSNPNIAGQPSITAFRVPEVPWSKVSQLKLKFLTLKALMM